MVEMSITHPSACTESHDPRFMPLVLFNAELELLADGFRWLEGPVWFGDQRCLLFNDIPNNRTLCWSEQHGVSTFLEPSEFANGQTRDRERRLIANGPRAMAAPSAVVHRALIRAEGHLALSHLHALAVHRFHPPAAAQGYDPLRGRVLVPLPLPAWRQYGEQHAHGAVHAFADPLGAGTGTDDIHRESLHAPLALAADSIGIGEHVPVGNRGWLRR